MGKFEDRFAALGRGMDRGIARVRGGMERSSGRPLVNVEAVREKVDHLKEEAAERGVVAVAWFNRLPKLGMLSVVLGAACLTLLIVVFLQWNSANSTGLPHKATTDEVAAMSALRAKMDTRASPPSPK